MDEEIKCSLTIDEDAHKITISGLLADSIEIDYSSDIDFTNLVAVLTEKIDEDKKVDFSFNEDIHDEKLQLIIDTIKDIIDIYNINLIDNRQDEVVEGD